MSWNLPDGCTQTDIDRAAGFLDDYEADDDDEPDEADLMETWDEDEPCPTDVAIAASGTKFVTVAHAAVVLMATENIGKHSQT